jgi:hypothetical protein
MLSRETLLSRVRGEYHEMPGLRLTLGQACRLWQIEALVCESVLQELVAAGILARTHDGAFIALPATRRALRSSLASPHLQRGA